MNRRIFDIIKNGKKIESENFIFFFKERSDALKICFQLSHHCANCVVRNRIKRIFRNLIRGYLEKGDIVIRAKTKCQHLTEDDIINEWEKVKKDFF